MGPRRRDASRVLILDAYDRLLLIKIRDPDRRIVVAGRTAPRDEYWITVGGGLEGDESYEAAARREIFEEVGIVDVVLGPVLWDRLFRIELDREPLVGTERYFVAWSATTDISFAHITDEEQTQFVEHRWWTYDALADDRRTDVAYPDELVELLQQALVLGRPTGTA